MNKLKNMLTASVDWIEQHRKQEQTPLSTKTVPFYFVIKKSTHFKHPSYNGRLCEALVLVLSN